MWAHAHRAAREAHSIDVFADTRRLAAWAAILAVPTMLAGIYGMNFEYMPELKLSYGYFLVLGGIAIICVTLYARLRHYGWL